MRMPERGVWLAAPWTRAGWVVLAVAMAVAANSVLRFRRAGTGVRPFTPATTLVATGAFRWTRNPMYCGMASFLLAWAAYLQSPLSVIGVLAFIGYITRFQIKPEERMLEKLFGGEFTAYRQRVRRWL